VDIEIDSVQRLEAGAVGFGQVRNRYDGWHKARRFGSAGESGLKV
jgi:hypothetical protein